MNSTTIAHELTARLAELLRRERGAMADFLLALADFDRQRLWLDLGYPSLFMYLHRELGLSKGVAHYRQTAARLLQRFPEIVDPLRDGRLCLSSVIELARVATPANFGEVLPRFFNRSRREAKEVAVEIRPLEVIPRRDLVTCPRPLAAGSGEAGPGAEGGAGAGVGAGLGAGVKAGVGAEHDRQPPADNGAAVRTSWSTISPLVVSPVELEPTHPLWAMPAQAPSSGQAPSPAHAPGPAPSPVQGPSPAQAGSLGQVPSPAQAHAPGPAPSPVQGPSPAPAYSPLLSPAPPPTYAEPLTADLRRLHVTVSRRFLAKLERARSALSHSRPGAGAEEILEAGLDLILAAEAKRKGAAARPLGKPRPSKPGHISASVKREVWNRDQGRCQWPIAGKAGGICGSTLRVEFDHIRVRARGGTAGPKEVRLLCRVHQAVAARQVFGDRWMDRFTRSGRRGSSAPRRNAGSPAG